jgi:hypothetical protein
VKATDRRGISQTRNRGLEVPSVRSLPPKHSHFCPDTISSTSSGATQSMATYFGVDFSGDHKTWRLGCTNSNVWIAILEVTNGIHAVNDLFQVQDLARRLGMSSPFAALVRFLQEGEFTAAGIDAPFSLPKAHMPAEGYRELLKHVSMMECGRRPFPSGGDLLSQLIQLSFTDLPHPRGRKIYRETEHGWIKQGVNVRSTTWNGPEAARPSQRRRCICWAR